MSTYQYRVVPAPPKGLKVKGIKGAEARFSSTLEELLNDMGAQGWEYQRAETLPSIERAGLTGSTTEWRNVLVFRKPHNDDDTAVSPELLAAPMPVEVTSLIDTFEDAENEATDVVDGPHPAGGDGAVKMLLDNGVEEASEVAGMTNSLKSLANRRSSKDSDS